MNRSGIIKDSIVKELSANRDTTQNEAMEKYMKNKFPFYGIKTPDRSKLVKQWLKSFTPMVFSERAEAANLLFQEEERECHYAALALLDIESKQPPEEAIDVYKELLTTKPWWDTVDSISSNLCGRYLLHYNKKLQQITVDWSNSDHMWVRRASLLNQLSFKEKTNEQLLFPAIGKLKHEKEFFIEKAIGWSLREYSKTAPQAVISFIESTELRPLSKREGLKWMKNKGIYPA
ncbi:DNA alkylation repair protein [Halobacillus shinanisalinarum]|uniref:DNA alkylation repair protein n=1 Tax=Halobacillus shinanisalinarum TaxID=2932258 RepID=A0ABY4GYL4_9BACI|nr:DNA alkylation repair protein [Halobacillus shinanisalinarum]UOQ93003.1 DNA alkylation repair protein [Halobacillus shinanisalinarum]